MNPAIDTLPVDFKLSEIAKLFALSSTPGASLAWDKQDDWQQQANSWRCTLRYQGRRYSFDYWMGQAHTGKPDVAGVLGNLFSDAQAGDQDFEDFCGDFGYDTDSRSAEKTYNGCRKIRQSLQRLLGDDFDLLITAENDI